MSDQLTPSAEYKEIQAEAILQRSIQMEMAEGKQSVGAFTEGVEDRVDEELENQKTQNIDAIASETHQLVKEYVSETDATLGSEHMVGDTASKGAAAWNDKGNGNEVVFDFEAVSRDSETPYWMRVRKHEEEHQLEQAAAFDMQEIAFKDEQITVNPNLVEWGAITAANQPSSDLTPDYKAYKAQGDELVAFLGSPEPLLKALKTGKMSELQAEIDRKIVEELYGKMGLSTADKRKAEELIALAA